MLKNPVYTNTDDEFCTTWKLHALSSRGDNFHTTDPLII